MKALGNALLTLALAFPGATAFAGNSIRNFHEVTDTFFRSGRLETRDFDALEDLGVKTILSLESDGRRSSAIRQEEQLAADHGITFLRVPMHETHKPTLEQINAALALVTDTDNQPILVHCYHGQDRTGIVAAAYRIRYQDWSIADATAELKELGHAPALYWWDDVLADVD